MLDKLGAIFGIVALGVGGYAAYQVRNLPVAETAIASGQQNISDDQIRNYLMENPEVLIEAAAVYEQRQEAQEALADIRLIEENRENLINDGYSLVAGNPDGDITIVEFSDYNCGFCKRAHNEITRFIETDSNVRVVIKEFPILGPGSMIAARAAMAAKEIQPSLAQEFNDELMSHRGRHTEDSVMSIAQSVGLDRQDLMLAMLDPTIEKNIKQNYALAQTLNINGTPAFVIGDQVVRGFVPSERLAELTALAREDG